jgi:hypothetical protein
VEVVGKLVTKFHKVEHRCSRLELPAPRICDLLLRPPPYQARLADHLDKATGQLIVELAAQWEADAELEALQTLAAQVWDMVLGSVDVLSSLTASMSVAVELLEGQIDTATTNGVRWEFRYAIVAPVSHFLRTYVV